MDKKTHAKRASLGKHGVERPSAKSRSRRGGWPVGIVAVALAGLLAAGGTVAWLADESGSVTNTFVPGQVTTGIIEGFDGAEKSDVYVANTSNVPVYVRAQVVVNWTDEDGNVVADVPAGYGYTMNPETLPIAASGWVEGDDGFYYYKKALAAADDEAASDDDKKTGMLINSVKVEYPQGVAAADAGYALSVEVLSEAIQALPDDAFNESWKASSGLTAKGGVLSKAAEPSQGE